MTDPQNVTKTPLFMCDSYRLIDLDIQFYGMQTPSELDFWTLYARVIPDWSEEPVWSSLWTSTPSKKLSTSQTRSKGWPVDEPLAGRAH